jgi:hypothetical protein
MGGKMIASVLEKKSSLLWELCFFETPALRHITPCKAPYNYTQKKKKRPCLYQCWVVTWFGQLERPVLVLVSEKPD